MEEIFRLLRPGGRLALLEFSRPENPVLGALFGLYFRNVLPRLGNAISGSGNAYSYLQQSVERFPFANGIGRGPQGCWVLASRDRFANRGIATLHLATK